MNFPMMSKQAKRRVTSAELAGGLNLRDGPSQCMDNQLTDMVNMWYKNGALRTRPGTEGIKYNPQTVDTSAMFNIKAFDIYKTNLSGEQSRLILIVPKSNFQDTVNYEFYWFSGEKLEKLPVIPYMNSSAEIGFVVEYQSTIYFYTPDGYRIFKLESGADKWDEISADEVYVPFVMVNCRTNGTTGDWVEADGYENYNLLGNKYKMVYSTINQFMLYESGETAHAMVYKLAQPIREKNTDKAKAGTTITAVITNDEGYRYTHTVTFDVDAVEATEKESPGDSLLMQVNAGSATVWFLKTDGTGTAYVNLDDPYIENNLEITAPYMPTEEEKRKVFNMTKSIWFGGTASGLENGTRIFLCGNTNQEEKALVCWSALNNPTYFPSANYAYVGESNQAVTCFEKQSDKLIIFKENETWYTQYENNNTIDASQLIYQEVIDIQSQGVYFPMVLINGHIGCDCPDTVQLCRNRLVWAHSRGKVYSLVSESNYTERSIYEVSDVVEPKLKGEDMRLATSADWQGYYALCCNNKLYLMDYNSYGYTHVYSYTKTEDANLRIPWHYWELNSSLTEGWGSWQNGIIMVGENLCFFEVVPPDMPSNGYNSTTTDILIYRFTDKKDTDATFEYLGLTPKWNTSSNKNKIKNYMTTKLFDFGEPNSFKNVCSVGLSLGYNGGNEITVTFVTDGGEEQTSIFLEDEAKERAADFIKSVILSPSIRAVVRFGVRLECEGLMIADGLTMDYRVTGRAR